MKTGSAKASIAGAIFLCGLASASGSALSADLTTSHTDWAYEPPPCSSYFEKTYDDGRIKFLWCASNRSPYEARLDAWLFANGRWTYYRTQHYDCQNAGDLALIGAITKQNVC